MTEETESKMTKPSANLLITPKEQVDSAKNTKNDPQIIEQWKRKAFEYDELFQFTRKTLVQRDELTARWKAETDKNRALQRLNKQMVEEKKHLLNEYNKQRNEEKDDDEDDEKKDCADAAGPSDSNLLRRQDTIRELE